MKRIALVFLAIAVLITPLVAQNATDIKFELRSATGSNRFQLGEVIPLELVFSSTRPGRYLEPCMYLTRTCFGYPQCRFANQWKFTITPADGWTDLQRSCATGSGPTFIVEDHDLTPQPKVIPYELTERFRFDKPGKYTVRFELNIGLDDDSNPKPKMFSGPFQTAGSEAVHHSVAVGAELSIEIVSADTQWQSEIIRKGVEAYSHDEPPRTDPLTPEFLQYRKDTTALCELGTPQAAHALARLMLREYSRVGGCLQRSPSRNAAILEMERLIGDPDTAITPAFFTELVVLRDYKEDERSGFNFIDQRDVDLERQRLIDAIPKKTSAAIPVSLIAVLHNPPMSTPSPGEQKYPTRFPDSVIALAAAHLSEFPADEQTRLLRDQWDLIRSPELLSALKRLAETNGYALLRWEYLDPAAATESAKKEILSPQPRFSSFYLRLPVTLPPAEENQLAVNFVTTANRNRFSQSTAEHDNLVRLASLLHGYGTRNVLPTVFPVIDAHRNEWPCAISFPVLAYLLKVSPNDAGPRVQEAVAKANHGPCNTGRIFTDLGFLEHGPVLEKLAFAQLSDQPGPFARDAAHYLRLYASADSKTRLWERLQYWQRRWAKLEKSNEPQKMKSEDQQVQALAADLRDSYTRAQAWMLTPEEEARLRVLLGEKGIQGEACKYSCGSELSVSKPALFPIYEAVTEPRYGEPPILDYLTNSSPHRYAVRQYSCPNMQMLKEKLLQFPAGSSFQFTWEFTARDRNDIIEIADFLRAHGYKIDNPQQWAFLQ